jgi:two-component system, cell cycle response regulator DivK
MWNDKTVLVAEDFEPNFLYLEAVLEQRVAKVIWAKNGQEAVDICKANKNIDLILMDIQMPCMNGLEATRAIKKIRNDVPIIAQTAYCMDVDRDKALNAGCDEYIMKPIQSNSLFEIIGKFL